jgi:hypothetical protein
MGTKISHNNVYSSLQEEYRKTGNGKMLERMYCIAKKTAGNYIKKYCKKKGIILNDIDEKAHDSAVYVIEQYLRKPGFKVSKISAYVHFGVIKSLFKNKDIEMKEVSYEQMTKKG